MLHLTPLTDLKVVSFTKQCNTKQFKKEMNNKDNMHKSDAQLTYHIYEEAVAVCWTWNRKEHRTTVAGSEIFKVFRIEDIQKNCGGRALGQ